MAVWVLVPVFRNNNHNLFQMKIHDRGVVTRNGNLVMPHVLLKVKKGFSLNAASK